METVQLYFFLINLVTFVHSVYNSSVSTLRIINGENVDISEIPYQVQIIYYLKLRCGGTILTRRHVISAAHCYDVSDFEHYKLIFRILAGTNSIAKGGKLFEILNVVQHPKYDRITVDYDVSVTLIDGYFDTFANMVPIKLNNEKLNEVAGQEGLVSGWGRVSVADSGPMSEELKKIYVPIFNATECKRVFPNKTITKQMFCAGYLKGEHDACVGDSGGPLVLNGKLFGIVSWGIGCATVNSLGVYTYVRSVKKWIRKQIPATTKEININMKRNDDANIGFDKKGQLFEINNITIFATFSLFK